MILNGVWSVARISTAGPEAADDPEAGHPPPDAAAGQCGAGIGVPDLHKQGAGYGEQGE